eukprot:m.254078 g.254078  ORF g.254078 m.254078 type:complete len:64 (+) comp19599_c0_seq1:224-415(+)
MVSSAKYSTLKKLSHRSRYKFGIKPKLEHGFSDWFRKQKNSRIRFRAVQGEADIQLESSLPTL